MRIKTTKAVKNRNAAPPIDPLIIAARFLDFFQVMFALELELVLVVIMAGAVVVMLACEVVLVCEVVLLACEVVVLACKVVVFACEVVVLVCKAVVLEAVVSVTTEVAAGNFKL